MKKHIELFCLLALSPAALANTWNDALNNGWRPTSWLSQAMRKCDSA